MAPDVCAKRIYEEPDRAAQMVRSRSRSLHRVPRPLPPRARRPIRTSRRASPPRRKQPADDPLHRPRASEGRPLRAERIDPGQPSARPIGVDGAHHLGEPDERRQDRRRRMKSSASSANRPARTSARAARPRSGSCAPAVRRRPGLSAAPLRRGAPRHGRRVLAAAGVKRAGKAPPSRARRGPRQSSPHRGREAAGRGLTPRTSARRSFPTAPDEGRRPGRPGVRRGWRRAPWPAPSRCPPRREPRGPPGLLDEFVVERVTDQLGTGGAPDLLLDVGAMRLHGANAQIELAGDLTVGVSESDQP